MAVPQLRITRLEQALQFGKGAKVLLSAGSALCLNERTEIQRLKSTIERLHNDGPRLRVAVISDAGDLGQEVDLPYVRP
ncbi:hypothetical protein SBA4_1670011 [Candidatus Sulfopaludibacter sp. SbA4]|nr:hypothetical protein SBA4_1670011 [Candidatus Sulfopaludibacter sp. SbA4]